MKTVILISLSCSLVVCGFIWFPRLTFWLLVAAILVVAYAFFDSADITDEEMKL